jgi:hypothetical protein
MMPTNLTPTPAAPRADRAMDQRQSDGFYGGPNPIEPVETLSKSGPTPPHTPLRPD